jgi:TolB-like protein
VVVLFAFCLLNPFAGWAYLAQRRDAQSMRPPSISDTIKPKRLAVLPLTGSAAIVEDWAETFEVELAEHESLLVVPIEPTVAALDPERDVLALGSRVHADLVLDATALQEDDELRVFARLIRMSDETVRWSRLFVGFVDDVAEIREEIRGAVLMWA